jgi:hypothetical protein
MYKIETYIPKESLQELRQALLEVDAGHIGKYRGCLSYYPVMGVWFSGGIFDTSDCHAFTAMVYINKG